MIQTPLVADLPGFFPGWTQVETRQVSSKSPVIQTPGFYLKHFVRKKPGVSTRSSALHRGHLVQDFLVADLPGFFPERTQVETRQVSLMPEDVNTR